MHGACTRATRAWVRRKARILYIVIRLLKIRVDNYPMSGSVARILSDELMEADEYRVNE